MNIVKLSNGEIKWVYCDEEIELGTKIDGHEIVEFVVRGQSNFTLVNDLLK